MRYSICISEYRRKNDKINIAYRFKRLDTADRRIQKVCTKPVLIPREGIFPAHALSWVGHSVRQSRELTSQQDREVVRSADSVYVMIANFSNVPLTIPKATILGVAEEASESLIDRINVNAEMLFFLKKTPNRI